MPDDEKKRHPAYGCLQFSRIGGRRRLWRRNYDAAGYIRLSIHTASLWTRELDEDDIWPEEMIVEVDLSAAQFAEAITHMNYGHGVPCTISRLQGAPVEEPPPEEDVLQEMSNKTQRHL